ncbi:hypothetical protein [Aggregatibacter actinomycetemcomitans]|uniref:hypothetical protein n=1 Tax=Aggregatibacter actinomycetemcomitans TaxID=714 RepID=UPI0011DD2684|nr:hypothetical protein [Aggregatibacter actinomycetemcomitans]QEH44596.1 hypothetical protein FXN58_02580 [Aggregatibacter actinomycetemcomitans]QEH48663.1 hypothetical protein FXN57_02580 [Aggregatibacter actinomycetemcomitans]
MRTLTKETKQVLSNILLVKGELKTQDHLLAVLAQIALTYNHDLTAKDYADLHNISLLSEAFYSSADKFGGKRNFWIKEENLSLKIFDAVLFFIEDREAAKDENEFIFSAVENMVADIDTNINADVLKAIKAYFDAQEAMEAAIKARKEKQAIAKAEKDIEAHSVTAKVLGLPTLTGSVKQIAWAEKIREKCLAIYPEEKIGKAAKTATTAKYWIDNYKNVLN